MARKKGLGKKLAIGLCVVLFLLIGIRASGYMDNIMTPERAVFLLGDIASMNAEMPSDVLN